MTRLRENHTVEDTIHSKLEPWVNNPPDYYAMTQAYRRLGQLNAAIKRKLREISKAEESVTQSIDKPRSNDAKIAKLNATTNLKDELSELEAEVAIIEADVKALEFMKVMFNASNYRTRLSLDF